MYHALKGEGRAPVGVRFPLLFPFKKKRMRRMRAQVGSLREPLAAASEFKMESLFFGDLFFWAPFCFSAGKKEGKKERSDTYVERKQDPKP